MVYACGDDGWLCWGVGDGEMYVCGDGIIDGGGILGVNGVNGVRMWCSWYCAGMAACYPGVNSVKGVNDIRMGL